MTIRPTLDITFELSFIDADKKNLMEYYEMILEKTRTGGFILIDNMLWSNKVLDTSTNHDADTLRIDKFNKYITNDIRVENVFLPFRDGIMMVRKK